MSGKNMVQPDMLVITILEHLFSCSTMSFRKHRMYDCRHSAMAWLWACLHKFMWEVTMALKWVEEHGAASYASNHYMKHFILMSQNKLEIYILCNNILNMHWYQNLTWKVIMALKKHFSTWCIQLCKSLLFKHGCCSTMIFSN